MTEPELDRFRAFDSTLDILRRFARSQLTIVLDDLHAADITHPHAPPPRWLANPYPHRCDLPRSGNGEASDRGQVLSDIACDGTTIGTGASIFAN
jgi:hypothetical protein